MGSVPDVNGGTPCPQCGTSLAPTLLSCPQCQRLVHAEELKRLAGEAERATRAGELPAAREALGRALALLPPQSRQHEILSALDQGPGETPAVPAEAAAPTPDDGPPDARRARGALAGLGALALVAWKFKFVAAFLLTKAKFLFLGLTKASTFFSMLLSLGVYWTAWGWKFALGLVLSMYVHEMGHVAALRRYGIPASAPMFVPGLGAFVRLKQHPPGPREDARVGLAGPLWGLFAALAAYGVFLASGWPVWAAIARFGAWLNLFNLLPVWQLDGGRGFRSLTRGQRWLAVGALGATLLATAEGLLVLLLIMAVLQALAPAPADEPDHAGLALYVFLVAILSALCLVPVPVGAAP